MYENLTSDVTRFAGDRFQIQHIRHKDLIKINMVFEKNPLSKSIINLKTRNVTRCNNQDNDGVFCENIKLLTIFTKKLHHKYSLSF